MTHAEAVAAEVAARYGIPVSPAVVQVIPRGVSGLPDPTAPVSPAEAKKAFTGAWYRSLNNRMRAAKFERAAAKRAEDAKPKRVKADPEVLRAARNAKKVDARLAAATAIAERLRGMADRPLPEVCSALAMSEIGVRRLATRWGIALTIPPKPKRTASEALLLGRKTINDRRIIEAAERKARVWSLADGTRTRAEIAALLGENLNYVDRALKGYRLIVAPKSPVSKADPGPRINPDDVQAALTEGLTLEQIAKRLGFHRSTVSDCIARHKLERPVKPANPKARIRTKPGQKSDWRQAQDEIRAKVAAMAPHGGTMWQMAQALGVSRQVVQRHMTALGLKAAPQSRTVERDAAMHAEWQAGAPYRALAAKYGISKSNVHRIVTAQEAMARGMAVEAVEGTAEARKREKRQRVAESASVAVERHSESVEAA
jgi:transposase